jgi:Rieske 2Fe-2S family protein
VPGPYAPHEYQVEEFIAWYIERLRDYGGLADVAGDGDGGLESAAGEERA